jgi:CRISPR-associated protein Csm5
MKTYYLKLIALSPIHIGTGQDYEPTNYVIDDGYLYMFDEIAFYRNLKQDERAKFNAIVSKENSDEALLGELYSFIRNNNQYAKQIALNKVKVTKELEKKAESIGKPVQLEGNTKDKNRGKPKSVFNQFQIQQTQKLSDSYQGYIPGSSLKGSIATAFQEYLYKNNGETVLKNHFNLGNNYDSDKLFRNLSISDSTAVNSELEIGYAVNKERFEDDDNNDVQTIVEVNHKDSSYLTTFTIKDLKDDNGNEISEKITEKAIIKACNDHYTYLYEEKENKKILLKSNQFLLCVGKHGGSRAVTIDGLRAIKVKMAEIKKGEEYKLELKSSNEPLKIKELLADENLVRELSIEKAYRNILKNYELGKQYLNFSNETFPYKIKENAIYCILKEETSVWKYENGLSFGWLLCEFIDENQYNLYYDKFKTQESEKIKEASKCAENSKKAIESLRLAQKQKEEEKEKALKAEQAKVEDEKARKASLSPFEKLIDDLISKPENSGILKTTIIFNELKSNSSYFGEHHSQAVELLYKIMSDEGAWKLTSYAKNKEKDKDYQRTLVVSTWLKEMK